MTAKSFRQLIHDRNERLANSWKDAESHRRAVSDALQQIALQQDRPRSLAVIGVGNGNDYELGSLAVLFDSVELFDLDESALARCVAHHQPADHVRVHPSLDITGCLADAADRLSVSEFRSLIDQLKPTECPAESPFDTVASVGLLSQLIDTVEHLSNRVSFADELPSQSRTEWGGMLAQAEGRPAVSQPAPLSNEAKALVHQMMFAVRYFHLQTLLRWTKPGGRILFVTDVVSSQTAPEMFAVPDDQLEGYLVHLVNHNNFFTACNPYAIEKLLQTDASLSPQVARIDRLKPWRWQIGEVLYLVSGFVINKTHA